MSESRNYCVICIYICFYQLRYTQSNKEFLRATKQYQ